MDEKELMDFYAVIEPKMQGKVIQKGIDSAIVKRCIPKKLGVKIYLDYILKAAGFFRLFLFV